MSQARDFFPNQELHPDTAKVYLKVWAEIAAKYKMERFSVALWNVLRRSQFFPLPYAIEEECQQTQRMAEDLPGSRMGVYSCPACGFQIAGVAPIHKCGQCGAEMRCVSTPHNPVVELKQHHDNLRAHPEEFISLADLTREVVERLAAKLKVEPTHRKGYAAEQ